MGIQYGQQHIDDADCAAVLKTLRSPYLTQGPEVERFERALAKECGARFAVAVSNGTMALLLAYLAVGIGEGDEVITTPNTFVATTNMLLALGAKPVFADIRYDTANIDETKIEALIGKRTRAIVPVHFAGHLSAMREIERIAQKHRLTVIADGAHALGASEAGLKLGAAADMTTLSFHPVKSITTGEGGAILTNDRQLYGQLLLLRSHGVAKDANGFNRMETFGYNARLTDVQAALGSSQLRKLSRFIKRRQTLSRHYKRALAGVLGITLPVELPRYSSAWHLYVIRTVRAKDRLPLYRFLRKNGIGANFHYPPVYSHPFYRRAGIRGRCPEMEFYAKRAITLPLHVNLAKRDVEKVAAVITGYFSNND